MTKKQKKKHDKIKKLTKPKLNSIELLFSKTLINSNISHDKLVLIDNTLKELYDIKKEVKICNDKKKF